MQQVATTGKSATYRNRRATRPKQNPKTPERQRPSARRRAKQRAIPPTTSAPIAERRARSNWSLSLGHWSFDPPPSPLAPSHNTRGFTNMSVTFGRVRHSSLGIRHFSGCYHADLSVKPDPANRLPVRPVSNTARRTRHAPREPPQAASSP